MVAAGRKLCSVSCDLLRISRGGFEFRAAAGGTLEEGSGKVQLTFSLGRSILPFLTVSRECKPNHVPVSFHPGDKRLTVAWLAEYPSKMK